MGLPTIDAHETPTRAHELAAIVAGESPLVIRNAFRPASVNRLLEAARQHAELIVANLGRGAATHFPPNYRWLERTLACDLGALDPNTSAQGSDDFNETSLHAAVMSPLVQDILRTLIGDDAGYGVVRTRVVLPRTEQNGSLPLHKETTAIPWPGLVVVWTPLTPPGILTNRDAPGIQFRTAAGEAFYPRLAAGDVVIFNGEIEHGSHIPETAIHWRVGCDIRLFPWTESNPIPAGTIALGYGPRRLKWRN